MRVRFFAGAADAAGRDESDVGDAGTLAELIERLGAGQDRLARVLAVSTFLVDGRRADPSEALAPNAVVDVLPPFAGG